MKPLNLLQKLQALLQTIKLSRKKEIVRLNCRYMICIDFVLRPSRSKPGTFTQREKCGEVNTQTPFFTEWQKRKGS
jgi:hypothetical protein